MRSICMHGSSLRNSLPSKTIAPALMQLLPRGVAQQMGLACACSAHE